MSTVKIFPLTGTFAENKDTAKIIRLDQIIPALSKGDSVILDFEKIDGVTQSFMHVLISDLIRLYGPGVIDKISFKACNETVQKIVTIVINYMQESL